MPQQYHVTLSTAMSYTVMADDVDHAKDRAREQLTEDFHSPCWLYEQGAWEVITVEEETP